MARYNFLLLLSVLTDGHTSASPVKAARSALEIKVDELRKNHSIFRIDPIFGLVTPSQEIKDYLASVFRQGGDGGDNPPEQPHDTGAELRPKNVEFQPNMGFEMYWPGGEYVARQADIDYCNTSDSACSAVFQKFGQVCAGSSDLRAHHTFKTICEVDDTNCRDGTASFYTNSENEKDIHWLPVDRNGGLHLKFSSPKVFYLFLTREKNINVTPQFFFTYDSEGEAGGVGFDVCLRNGTFHEPWRQLGRASFYPQNWRDRFVRNMVRSFYISWNEAYGIAKWVLKDRNRDGQKDYTDVFPWLNSEYGQRYRNERKFPVRYIGIMGGTKSNPSWFELTGYLMAYRGRCREDLPTLAPDVPDRISQRHKIQLFNFAERMDVFGYHFSRVPSSTINDYGDDYFVNYHQLP